MNTISGWGKISEGTVLFKAYEITQNTRLSKGGLSKSSSVPVSNLSDSLKRFGTNDHFTIYEGDWGKPYAARFELWYKPEKGEEKKLTENNYIIEGWQH